MLKEEKSSALIKLGDIVGYALDWDIEEIKDWTDHFAKIKDKEKRFSELKKNMIEQCWNTLDIWDIYFGFYKKSEN